MCNRKVRVFRLKKPKRASATMTGIAARATPTPKKRVTLLIPKSKQLSETKLTVEQCDTRIVFFIAEGTFATVFFGAEVFFIAEATFVTVFFKLALKSKSFHTKTNGSEMSVSRTHNDNTLFVRKVMNLNAKLRYLS